MKELDLDINLSVMANEQASQWRANNQYQFSWGSEDFWGGGAPAAGLPVTTSPPTGSSEASTTRPVARRARLPTPRPRRTS